MMRMVFTLPRRKSQKQRLPGKPKPARFRPKEMMMLSQDAYPTRTQNSAAILARHDPVVYEHTEPKERNARLTTAQRASYEQNGFLLMPELFNQEEVAYLYDAMQTMREEFTHAGRKEVIAE